jgi:predicted Zn-dependent protease
MVSLGLTAGAWAISLISVENEIAIGRQANEQVRREITELKDRAVQEYVRALGATLVASAPGPRYPYTFEVANYRDVNAFALPGGPIWIHRGTLQTAGSEAEIVGVLAHEIAHVAQRHAASQLMKSLVANGFMGLLGALLGNDVGATAARIGAGVLANGIFLKFSRDDEFEADRVGASIVSRAGWDPRGLVSFMQVLRREQGRDPGAVEVILSTHPSPEGRMERLQQEVRKLRPGNRSSGRFQEVKRRLTQLPRAPQMPRR